MGNGKVILGLIPPMKISSKDYGYTVPLATCIMTTFFKLFLFKFKNIIETSKKLICIYSRYKIQR